MKDDRLTKTVHRWKSIGKRSAGWPNKSWMDCSEEDLWRSGVTKCGKTTGRQRMTLNDIATDRKQWRNLTTASVAEIIWTMNTWIPDLNWYPQQERWLYTVFEGLRLILQIVYTLHHKHINTHTHTHTRTLIHTLLHKSVVCLWVCWFVRPNHSFTRSTTPNHRRGLMGSHRPPLPQKK